MQQAEQTRRFRAGACQLQIKLPAPIDAPLATLHDAMLLCAVDPLLRGIDGWLGESLDWHPVADDGAVDAVPVIELMMRGQPGFQTMLCLQGDQLHTLRPWTAPPGAGIDMRWVEHRAAITLTDVPLSPADHQRLAAGSLLLLPQSFQGVLDACLSCDDVSGLQYNITINQDDPDGQVCRTRSADCSGPAAETGANTHLSERASITLEETLTIPACDWRPGLEPGTRLAAVATLVGQSALVCSDGSCWTGEIVPLGKGLGVLLHDASCSTPTGIHPSD